MNKLVRGTLYAAGLAIAFGAGAGIGNASAGNTASPAPVIRTVPGPTVTQTVAGPTVTASPPAPASGQLIGKWHGSGNENTPSFNANGNIVVSWNYSGNIDPSIGGGTNFSISNTNSNAYTGTLPNDIAVSGHGSTEITDDTGPESFNVQSAPGCNWTITVTAAP